MLINYFALGAITRLFHAPIRITSTQSARATQTDESDSNLQNTGPSNSSTSRTQSGPFKHYHMPLHHPLLCDDRSKVRLTQDRTARLALTAHFLTRPPRLLERVESTKRALKAEPSLTMRWEDSPREALNEESVPLEHSRPAFWLPGRRSRNNEIFWRRPRCSCRLVSESDFLISFSIAFSAEVLPGRTFSFVLVGDGRYGMVN